MPAATSEVDLAREGIHAGGHSSEGTVHGVARAAQEDVGVSDDDVRVVGFMRRRHRKTLRGLPALAGSGMMRPPL
jgi:hypothetical protein